MDLVAIGSFSRNEDATVSTDGPVRPSRKATVVKSQFATHAELFDLSGKHGLVTGGTRGIGMMIARGLLQAGVRVAISSRSAEACARAQERLSDFGDIWAIPADLSRHEECVRLAHLVTADSGSLDILVNNAGAMWDEPLATFPDAAWDTVIDLNLKAPFWLVQALLPALRSAGTANDPARIINVGPARLRRQSSGQGSTSRGGSTTRWGLGRVLRAH
jgi:NAD(P)-dependent dehydrogenase (short-subunit alcohol dehydrogenase family)